MFQIVQRVRGLTGLFLLLLLGVNGCSVNVPEAYPPAHRPQQTPRYPVPSRPRPVPAPSPGRIEPVPHRAPVIKPDEPEAGENPYEKLSQSDSVKSSQPERVQPDSSMSPAVKSLLTQAKANLVAQRTGAAISKLERALRIAPRNPVVWHQLGQAHYQEGKDTLAISMARKSNLYAAAGSPLEKQNWQLIRAASKRSGNIKVLKEAIRYERANP